MAITKQQIIDAAEQLCAEGTNPSMAAVRKKLGGGSFATISPVLREWRNSQEETTVAILDMPAEIKKAVESAGATLWKTANQIASQQIEKSQHLAREQVAAAIDERDEAIKEIERLENHINSLKTTIDSQEQKIKEFQQQQTDAARREGRLEAELKAARSELEFRNQTIKEQKTEISDFKKREMKQQKAYANLEGELKATLQMMQSEKK